MFKARPAAKGALTMPDLADLFPGYASEWINTSAGRIFARVGGKGPPLLCLHGYPETHLMWHSTAPALAQRHTVVCPDLPGYGDSFRPAPTDDHSAHSKRAMANDLVQAMAALGHERFSVAGHDRGARVAYRMALDNPERVERLAVLDVVPTGEIWKRADVTFALIYWHWGFLSQAAPLPEQLIDAAPDAFFDTAVRRMGIEPGAARFPDEVVDDYRRRLHDPGAVEAMCEDYRAGASVDRQADDEDRRHDRTIACSTLVLWGANGALPVFYGDPLEIWSPWCDDVRGRAVDAGHFLVEDRPDEVAGELLEFFGPG
jgi:haloacetate dehalogenase